MQCPDTQLKTSLITLILRRLFCYIVVKDKSSAQHHEEPPMLGDEIVMRPR
jgi:hypothetical protein